MTGYPTPERWREFAAHANKMADEYAAEGNYAKALQRRLDAEDYEFRADLAEYRAERMNSIPETALKVLEAMS